MPENESTETDRTIDVEVIESEVIERDVCQAVAADPASIAEEVRTITLKALASGELDREGISRVAQAVIAGARKAAEAAPDSTQALKDAARGLDEALAAAAEATFLTLQESTDSARAFSRQALRERLEDLKALESLFVATLNKASAEAAGAARSTLSDLSQHARDSGTAVGARVQESISQLSRAITDAVSDQTTATTEALRKETALLAATAAGVLRGIAERLQPSTTAEAPAPKELAPQEAKETDPA